MTSKRKAELQRKLTLASVPRPPAGLEERIKADIPKYLNVEAERERFSRSIGMNFRVAAAILVLVSAAAMLYMVAPAQRSLQVAVSETKGARAVNAKQVAPMDEVQVEITQASPTSGAAAARQVAQVAPAANQPFAFADTELQRRDAEGDARANSQQERVEGISGSVAGGVAGGTVASVVPPPAAPVPPPPAPAAPLAADAVTVNADAPAIAPEPVAKAARMRESTSLISEAHAASFTLSPKSVFGISIDPEVFQKIKTTIERGNRPLPATVNVEALVNYFAGAPQRRVKRGVRLEIEASPAPVQVERDRGVFRFTIDTASIDLAEGASSPPIATDARVEIEFNPAVVKRYEEIGDGLAARAESALLHNTSVTGLYALTLNTPLNTRATVATVRLHYRSVADGRPHTIVRVLRATDFQKQWSRASRRHRLASLGALWGESLRSTKGGTDVARRAEELASQDPGDERARELAAAAVASSGGSR